MIITGVLIIKFGFSQNVLYERILGWIFITFGSMNLVLDFIRKVKK